MDITYITDKVAIMGSFYENDSLNEVRAHMKSRHDKHHTIYNVSSEPEYNIEQDIDNVRNFPFNANNPCALNTLTAICCDMESYLNVNANNVIFIHCRTGLGRSGFIAACFLLHTGVFVNAAVAIEFVNKQRRLESMNAITCPSHIRYVHYYEALLRSEGIQSHTYKIKHIRLHTVPSFSPSIINCGCTPSIHISLLSCENNTHLLSKIEKKYYPKQIFSLEKSVGIVPLRHYSCEHDVYIDFSLYNYNIHIRNDVCLNIFSDNDKMCQLYFHTGYIKDNYLCFEKSHIDMACDDVFHYTFDANFKIEIAFESILDEPELNVLDQQQQQQQQASTYSGNNAIDWEFIHNYGDTNIPEIQEDIIE